jgi:hypothetical protein
MCVIAVCATDRITSEQCHKMYSNNPHGAGFAWREEEGKKKRVIWRKGLEREQAVELAATLPLPYVVHFRVPSCGGPGPLLTHPFPIEKDVPLELEGSTEGFVLFHNGHWGKFKDTMLEAAVRNGAKIPNGRWSDSRSMAWMAAHFGIGMLEFINEKVAIFGPNKNDIELFGDHGWQKLDKTGIWVSNKGWEHENVSSFMKPRQVTAGTKKSADGAKKEDKEEPQTRQVALPSTSNSALKAGTPNDDPFYTYSAAVRLWKKGDISNNGFKRARKAYEVWCRSRKMQPLPRPDKGERGTVH